MYSKDTCFLIIRRKDKSDLFKKTRTKYLINFQIHVYNEVNSQENTFMSNLHNSMHCVKTIT